MGPLNPRREDSHCKSFGLVVSSIQEVRYQVIGLTIHTNESTSASAAGFGWRPPNLADQID